MYSYQLLRASFEVFRKIPVPEVDHSNIIAIAPGIFGTVDLEPLKSSPGFKGFIRWLERGFVLSNKQLNATLHKSWAKIRNAPYLQLVLEQVVHYISTYGFEALGINDGPIYIPHEELDVPLDTDLPVIILQTFSFEDMKESTLNIVRQNVALSENTLENLEQIMSGISRQDKSFLSKCIKETKNKELKIRLAAKFRRPPEFPPDMVRYIVYRLLNRSQIIKDPQTLWKLQRESKKLPSDIEFLLKTRQRQLAQVFYRFKDVFLAIKTGTNKPKVKNYINRISKLAKTNHVPMKLPLYIQLVSRANKGTLDLKQAKSVIEKLSTTKLLKIYNTIGALLAKPDARLFRIRNGKIFLLNENVELENRDNLIELQQCVKTTIISKMRAKLTNFPLFIFDDFISVPVPESEKKFLGNVPEGTRMKFNEPYALFGIHWNNFKGIRIDLDLSAHTFEGKVGWDGAYRRGGILMSGDMTSAPPPHGATEIIKIPTGKNITALIGVTFYNPEDLFYLYPDDKLEFTFWIGQSHSAETEPRLVTQDEVKVRLIDHFTRDRKSTFVCLFHNDTFFLLSGTTSVKRSLHISSDLTQGLLDYYTKYFQNMLQFSDIAEELQDGFSEEEFTTFDFSSLESISREQLLSFL